MIKAIYKIENKKNHKIYIGQSNNPDRRFQEHCHKREKYISLIDRAIHKWGQENFSVEILEWCENYNEREKYYISFFRSLAPNGYNIVLGGEEPPHNFGEKNSFAKISNETAKMIKQDLKNWEIQKKQIMKKYNVSADLIRHINEGDSWHDDKEIYPLRPKERELNNQRANKAIKLLILTDMPQHEIGSTLGWSCSAIKEINAGRNHHNDKLIYPIRNHKKENKAILNL